MKKLLVVIGIVSLGLVIGYQAFAHGPGWGGGRHMMGYWGTGPYHGWHHGPAYNWDMSEEQSQRVAEIEKEFYDQTAELREELWSKSSELETVLSSADPDLEKAKALQKEISALKDRITEKELDYELQLRKAVPDARYAGRYGRGYGYHMRGYGPGGCRF
jgi:zinc resistance-associated protein